MLASDACHAPASIHSTGVSIRRRPASQLAWVSEDFAARERRTRALATLDERLLAVEDWNECNGADSMVPWELLNACLRGGAGAEDGSISGAALIEYLLGEQEALMRPRLAPRNGLRAEYASRR